MMFSHPISAIHAAPAPRTQMHGLPGSDEDPLCGRGVRVGVARDDVLFNEGDEARSCYRIVSGAIRIVKIMADGRRYVVDFHLPGDFVSLDSAEAHEFTAEAIVDSVLVRYARPRVDTSLEDNPQRSRRLLQHALQRLAAAQSQMLLLGRMTATERIATFLLNLERRAGTEAAGIRAISLAMTRADIADHLGLTLETVSRMLNQLKRQGIIALPHPQRICVLKPEKLRALAVGA
ncbi:MAG TPA: helix-turn-helix domain-containing protein [Vineibacter sp.]|nr:helix-turn-helix domain-containing protein [Vineibacter sp.]